MGFFDALGSQIKSKISEVKKDLSQMTAQEKVRAIIDGRVVIEAREDVEPAGAKPIVSQFISEMPPVQKAGVSMGVIAAIAAGIYFLVIRKK